VTLRDGHSYHAMCAIDALGIPYMLDQPGEIQSQELDGREMVRVAVDPERGLKWTPATAVAVAAFGEGRCLAQSACPHINLFASRDAAARYLDSHALHGGVLSITDAVAAGRWQFGGLLRTLTDTVDH
jgi:alkylmercury lyase